MITETADKPFFFLVGVRRQIEPGFRHEPQFLLHRLDEDFGRAVSYRVDMVGSPDVYAYRALSVDLAEKPVDLLLQVGNGTKMFEFFARVASGVEMQERGDVTVFPALYCRPEIETCVLQPLHFFFVKPVAKKDLLGQAGNMEVAPPRAVEQAEIGETGIFDFGRDRGFDRLE